MFVAPRSIAAHMPSLKHPLIDRPEAGIKILWQSPPLRPGRGTTPLLPPLLHYTRISPWWPKDLVRSLYPRKQGAS